MPADTRETYAHRVALVSVIATSAALGGAALIYLHRLVLWFVLGFVLVELFSAMATALHRRLPGPRSLWVAASLAIVLTAVAGTVVLVSVPLVHQVGELGQAIPRGLERVEKSLARFSARAEVDVRGAGDVGHERATNDPTSNRSPEPGTTAVSHKSPEPKTTAVSNKSPEPETTAPTPSTEGKTTAPNKSPEPHASESPSSPATADGPSKPVESGAALAVPIRDAVTDRLPAFAATTIPILVHALDGAFDILGVIFFAAFVAAAPDQHRRGLLMLVPAPVQPRVEHFLDEAGTSLRKWLSAVAVSMAIVGTVMTTALFLLGVKSWLFFGLLFAAMELVPYAGPFLGAVGPILECVLDHQPGKAAAVGILFLVVQLAMTNLVTPYLVRWQTEIPGSLALAAILGMGAAAGALGVLVAVPFLAIVLAAAHAFAPSEPVVIAGGA